MSYYKTISSTISKIMFFCFIVSFLLTMPFTRLIWIEYIIFCTKNKYMYWDELFFVSFFVLSRLAKISSFTLTTTFHVYCCSWKNIYIWFYSFNGRNILLLDVILLHQKVPWILIWYLQGSFYWLYMAGFVNCWYLSSLNKTISCYILVIYKNDMQLRFSDYIRNYNFSFWGILQNIFFDKNDFGDTLKCSFLCPNILKVCYNTKMCL